MLSPKRASEIEHQVLGDAERSLKSIALSCDNAELIFCIGEQFGLIKQSLIAELTKEVGEYYDKRIEEKEQMSSTSHKYNRKMVFEIEISEVHTHYDDNGNPFSMYRVKGFDSLVLTDSALNKLVQQMEERRSRRI